MSLSKNFLNHMRDQELMVSELKNTYMTSVIKRPELHSTKSTVLIVDDQSTSRLILENIAKTIDDNVEVKCFDNAYDALLEAESSAPDLILTDYKMPDIDGVEFIERLRNNVKFRDIPIVIITALDDCTSSKPFELRVA